MRVVSPDEGPRPPFSQAKYRENRGEKCVKKYSFHAGAVSITTISLFPTFKKGRNLFNFIIKYFWQSVNSIKMNKL
jgi:hypothetical protein